MDWYFLKPVQFHVQRQHTYLNSQAINRYVQLISLKSFSCNLWSSTNFLTLSLTFCFILWLNFSEILSFVKLDCNRNLHGTMNWALWQIPLLAYQICISSLSEKGTCVDVVLRRISCIRNELLSLVGLNDLATLEFYRHVSNSAAYSRKVK